jgi:hypothetical protein
VRAVTAFIIDIDLSPIDGGCTCRKGVEGHA